jgi:hypothetical protein
VINKQLFLVTEWRRTIFCLLDIIKCNVCFLSCLSLIIFISYFLKLLKWQRIFHNLKREYACSRVYSLYICGVSSFSFLFCVCSVYCTICCAFVSTVFPRVYLYTPVVYRKVTFDTVHIFQFVNMISFPLYISGDIDILKQITYISNWLPISKLFEN